LLSDSDEDAHLSDQEDNVNAYKYKIACRKAENRRSELLMSTKLKPPLAPFSFA
jgi:hypothetical protein